MSVPNTPLVEPAEQLTPEEFERYSRHILLPEVGEQGQRRLKNARVLVIGAGGLGSPALLYLAAAGVGTLGIVDDDHVDVSNLQRQVIHGVNDLGTSKLESARAAILELNPLLDVRLHSIRLDASNALELFAAYDLVIDGSDNFATRYLASDAAAILGMPHVWGAVAQFEGQLSVFWAKHGLNYRQLYPDAPPPGAVLSCGEGGVFGMLCGVIGSMLATEAVKLITAVGEPLLGRVLLFNALSSSWRELSVQSETDAGSSAASVGLLSDYEEFCGVPSPQTAPTRVQPQGQVPDAAAAASASITAQQLAALLERRSRAEADFELIDVREPGEHALVSIPGSRLVPLAQILAGDVEFSLDRELVLYCKVGLRSEQARDALARLGHERLQHLSGGVLAWLREIEPAKPSY